MFLFLVVGRIKRSKFGLCLRMKLFVWYIC